MKTRSTLTLAASALAIATALAISPASAAATNLMPAFDTELTTSAIPAISPETEHPKISGPMKTKRKARRKAKSKRRKVNPKINPRGFDATDDERNAKK